MEFLKVNSVETAREKLLTSVKDWEILHKELPLDEANGSVLAVDIFSPNDIPAFRRSTVDGYAVVAADTAAAGESLPVFLSVKGRLEIGADVTLKIGRGECAEVPTAVCCRTVLILW